MKIVLIEENSLVVVSNFDYQNAATLAKQPGYSLLTWTTNSGGTSLLIVTGPKYWPTYKMNTSYLGCPRITFTSYLGCLRITFRSRPFHAVQPGPPPLCLWP